MNAKTTARGLGRSLRIVGLTAAVAAGVIGFSTVDAPAGSTHVVAASANSNVPNLPAQACEHAMDHAFGHARPFLSCIVIDGPGPIVGPPIMS